MALRWSTCATGGQTTGNKVPACEEVRWEWNKSQVWLLVSDNSYIPMLLISVSWRVISCRQISIDVVLLEWNTAHIIIIWYIYTYLPMRAYRVVVSQPQFALSSILQWLNIILNWRRCEASDYDYGFSRKVFIDVRNQVKSQNQTFCNCN